MDAALTVLNAGVRLSIHPRSGGKISEVFAVSLGRNLLAEPSPEAVLALENGRQFSVSGWDEAFPTLEPCGAIPTLGYAWRTPADCALHDHQLITQWEFDDWRLARTIRLEPMGLAVSYVITNQADTPRPALWAGHVLMTLNEFQQAQLPAGEIFPGPGLHLESLKEILLDTDQGWVIPHSPDRGRSWKFFLPNRQPVTLCYSDARVVLTSEAPWWGIWLNLGALHTRCIGVEPTTFPTDCLRKVNPPFGPGESVSTSWRLAIQPVSNSCK